MMSNAQEITTGRDYSISAALGAGGLVFVPAVLLVSGPVGLGFFATALVASLVFLACAWGNWRQRSRLTIPSILSRGL
jgi:hypothetical protein